MIPHTSWSPIKALMKSPIDEHIQVYNLRNIHFLLSFYTNQYHHGWDCWSEYELILKKKNLLFCLGLLFAILLTADQIWSNRLLFLFFADNLSKDSVSKNTFSSEIKYTLWGKSNDVFYCLSEYSSKHLYCLLIFMHVCRKDFNKNIHNTRLALTLCNITQLYPVDQPELFEANILANWQFAVFGDF